MQIDEPNNALVSKYLDKFNNDPKASSDDKAIFKLVQKFPKNQVIEDVILKSSVINALYRTKMYDTYPISVHILNLNIDEDIKNGNLDVVSKIAIGHGYRNSRQYSFATKYCSFHNKDVYPIFDRRVKEMLIMHRDLYKFSSFEDDDLLDYTKYVSIIYEFIEKFNLKFSLKEIDKYLWYYHASHTSKK